MKHYSECLLLCEVQLLKKYYVESNPGKMCKEHILGDGGLRTNPIFHPFLPIHKE